MRRADALVLARNTGNTRLAAALATPGNSLPTTFDTQYRDEQRGGFAKLTATIRIPIVLRNPLNNRQHWRKVRNRSWVYRQVRGDSNAVTITVEPIAKEE